MPKLKEPSKKIPPHCDRCNRGIGVVEHAKKLYCFRCIQLIRNEQELKQRNGILW